MAKVTDTFTGKIHCIGEIISVQRKDKQTFDKRTIGVQKEDGQIGFFEMRKNLEAENIQVGLDVTVHYYWAGSIKDKKWYNNIVITHIQPI